MNKPANLTKTWHRNMTASAALPFITYRADEHAVRERMVDKLSCKQALKCLRSAVALA